MRISIDAIYQFGFGEVDAVMLGQYARMLFKMNPHLSMVEFVFRENKTVIAKPTCDPYRVLVGDTEYEYLRPIKLPEQRVSL